MKYSTRGRRKIVEWHHANGMSVSATCRHFGLSRSTLYRWLERFDPERPGKSLKARSRRPGTKRSPQWTDRHLALVADQNLRQPTYGKRRMHLHLQQDGIPLSESTVGRLLRIVRQRCPVCGGTQGQHLVGVHHIRRDIGAVMPDSQHLMRR